MDGGSSWWVDGLGRLVGGYLVGWGVEYMRYHIKKRKNSKIQTANSKTYYSRLPAGCVDYLTSDWRSQQAPLFLYYSGSGVVLIRWSGGGSVVGIRRSVPFLLFLVRR